MCVCSRDVKRVLFVPYALHDRDAYTKTARDKFRTLGASSLYRVSCFLSVSVHESLFMKGRFANKAVSSVPGVFDPAGYEVDGVHEASDPVEAVRKAEGIFIGEEQGKVLQKEDLHIPPSSRRRLRAQLSVNRIIPPLFCRRREHVPAAEESL